MKRGRFLPNSRAMSAGVVRRGLGSPLELNASVAETTGRPNGTPPEVAAGPETAFSHRSVFHKLFPDKILLEHVVPGEVLTSNTDQVAFLRGRFRKISRTRQGSFSLRDGQRWLRTITSPRIIRPSIWIRHSFRQSLVQPSIMLITPTLRRRRQSSLPPPVPYQRTTREGHRGHRQQPTRDVWGNLVRY